MKNIKIALIIFSILILNSCNKSPERSDYEKVYYQMTLKDFFKNHPLAKNEYLRNDLEETIYSIIYKGKNKRFYYFERKYLYLVDNGSKAVKYNIKFN